MTIALTNYCIKENGRSDKKLHPVELIEETNRLISQYANGEIV